jgi:hypothetical protein
LGVLIQLAAVGVTSGLLLFGAALNLPGMGGRFFEVLFYGLSCLLAVAVRALAYGAVHAVAGAAREVASLSRPRLRQPLHLPSWR